MRDLPNVHEKNPEPPAQHVPTAPQLSPHDAKNLLVLLDRVQVQGTKEAFALSDLAGKLQAIASQ
jgi:hypothetical protein